MLHALPRHLASLFALLVLGLATAAPALAQAPAWAATGALAGARYDHTATRLADGRILVVGGQAAGGALATAELYDPVDGTWSAAPDLTTGRTRHAAVRLFDGRVMVAGGLTNLGVATNTVELFDPATNTWSAAANLNAPRVDFTLTQLLTGGVLAAGTVANAEGYNPAANTWTLAFAMRSTRSRHTATLLRDGRVLVAGGTADGISSLASTELMNPDTFVWSDGPDMSGARAVHSATVLSDGKVMLAGGTRVGGPTDTADLFDPGTNTIAATGALPSLVAGHHAILLADGDVLIVGGDSNLRAEELNAGRTGSVSTSRYDADAGTFAAADALAQSRIGHTATILSDGNVLVVGGAQFPDGERATAERYSSEVPPPPGPEIVDTKDPANPCLIRFSLESVPSGPSCGPYSFSLGQGDDAIDFFANLGFFTDGGSVTTATSENLDVIAGTAGVSLTFTGFRLALFEHIDPARPGFIGDRRIYTGGIGEIKEGGVTKLRGIDGSLAITAHYPVPVGPGDLQVAVGYMRIDAANSDPAWVAEFDPDGTGMVRMDWSSFSDVGQVCAPGTPCTECFGSYDAGLCLRPYATPTLAGRGAFNGNATPSFDFGDVDVAMAFQSADFTNLRDTNEGYALAERITADPGGALPGGVAELFEGHYWRLGTNVAAFNTTLTFDLDDVGGIADADNLVLLKRETKTSPWQIVPNTSSDGSTLVATGVTDFSEWAIASTGGNALPVELADFDALLSGDAVLLRWATASETNNAGFAVEVQTSAETWASRGFVLGAGTTAEAQRYTFAVENLAPGTHRFRLRQMDYDGSVTYSPVIEAEVSVRTAFSLAAPFPHPIAGAATVGFSLREAMPATLDVFDVLGRRVARLHDGPGEAGTTSLAFDAETLPSGLYVLRLTTPLGATTRTVTVAR